MRTIKLTKGKGVEGQSHCVMAATSIVAGEEFSDKPACVCPTITAALIFLNDSCPTDEIRERLLGHLPWLIIGTRGAVEHEVKRAKLFASYTPISFARYAAAHAATCLDGFSFADASIAAADASVRAARDVVGTYFDVWDTWCREVKKFVDFIEEEIIPVYSTMPVEPGFRIEELCC